MPKHHFTKMASKISLFIKCTHKCHSLQRYSLPHIRSFKTHLALNYGQPNISKDNNSLILTSQADGIRRIVLNNEKQRNSLSLMVLDRLFEELSHDIHNSDLRVIVLSANGPVFSSGHNLKELTAKEGQDYHSKVFERCSNMMLLIQSIPVPVVAQVRGLAAAAGCQLVATCDIAIASENATFSTPGANFGLFCSTPGIALARAVPRKVAMEMLCTGEPISAAEALQHGLISRVVADSDLEKETLKTVDAICKKSRSVVALGKSFFYSQIAMDIQSAYRQGEKIMVKNLAMADGKEGIDAFVGKRKPRWSHLDS